MTSAGNEQELSTSDDTLVLFAALPLFAAYSDFSTGSFMVILTGLVFMATVLFFKFCRILFPEVLLKACLLMWLAILGHAVYLLAAVSGWWIFSLILLGCPLKNNGETILSLKKAGKLTAGFVVWAAVAMTFREYIFGTLHWKLFESPAGYFLIAAAASIFWKHHEKVRNDKLVLD